MLGTPTLFLNDRFRLFVIVNMDFLLLFVNRWKMKVASVPKRKKNGNRIRWNPLIVLYFFVLYFPVVYLSFQTLITVILFCQLVLKRGPFLRSILYKKRYDFRGKICFYVHRAVRWEVRRGDVTSKVCPCVTSIW